MPKTDRMQGLSSKRHIGGVSKDTHVKKAADREQLTALIADTENQLQKRFQDLQQVCQQVKLTQTNKYHAKMTKFSSSVKGMTLREMKEKHGFDLLSRVLSPSSKANVAGLETPSRGRNDGNALTTPSTTRRRRETLLYVALSVG